jgi:hypothetical protein
MRKLLFTVFSILIMSFINYGQSPLGFKYQALIKSPQGIILKNQNLAVRFKIQEDSAEGTMVYSEIFLTSTNAYGLVDLEIGLGTSTDDFSIIDWSNGPHFLETAFNFLSGNPWIVMGTSEFLSVPYTLHSNTTDKIIGGINSIELDPVFFSSLANTLTATDTAKWNITDTQLDSIGISNLGFVAGPKIIDTDTQLDSIGISNLGFVAGPKTINTQIDSIGISNFGYVAEKTYSIGLWPELGGFVFRISSDGKHGLVAETQNQAIAVRWYTCDSVLNDPTLHSLNGKKFFDWRLPTKFELNEMWVYRFNIGGVSNRNFWSSTEKDFGKVWGQIFGINSSGAQFIQARNDVLSLRTIRSF